MRLIYFTQDYTPHDFQFLEKLAQSTHEVWYLRFEANPVPLETRPLPSGIKVVEWTGNRTYKLSWWGKVKLFREFRKTLRKIQPDLIHAGPVQTCGFFTALAGFKMLFLMSWGSDILTVSDRNAIWQWITRFTIRHAFMIICDCMAVQDKIIELTNYPTDRIIRLPWGVDLSLFHPAPSRLKLRDNLGWRDNKVIITTRSFESIYGIDVFLKAVVDVVKIEPRARFLMMGDGSLRNEMESFITRHSLEQVIHLTGRISHDSLPAYFNEAYLYVSTSYSDGTSVSLLEAMACGLPVIVTDIPSNREWISPGVNGWLVPARNVRMLSSAIVEALQNDDISKSMANANRLTVQERADWNMNFPTLLDSYQRAAGENAG